LPLAEFPLLRQWWAICSIRVIRGQRRHDYVRV
jgi:hypothetical protein